MYIYSFGCFNLLLVKFLISHIIMPKIQHTHLHPGGCGVYTKAEPQTRKLVFCGWTTSRQDNGCFSFKLFLYALCFSWSGDQSISYDRVKLCPLQTKLLQTNPTFLRNKGKSLPSVFVSCERDGLVRRSGFVQFWPFWSMLQKYYITIILIY